MDADNFNKQAKSLRGIFTEYLNGGSIDPSAVLGGNSQLFTAIALAGQNHYAGMKPKKYARHLANLFVAAEENHTLEQHLMNSDYPLGYSLKNPQVVLTPIEAMVEAAKCYSCEKPSCQEKKGEPVCRAGNPIKDILYHVMHGDFDSARSLLDNANTTADLTCQGCRNGQSQEEYCQSKCTSGQIGININIPEINRAVSRYGKSPVIMRDQHEGNVVMIGDGPSSLRAAIDLAQHGVKVNVHGRLNVGGVMVTEKPPKKQDMGVYERIKKKAIDAGVIFTFGNVFEEEFEQFVNDPKIDAVYVGTGKTVGLKCSKVKVDGKSWECKGDESNAFGISTAKYFLYYFDLGYMNNCIDPIYVIDTGFTSLDIAMELAENNSDFRLLCYGGKTRMGDDAWQKELSHVGLNLDDILVRNILPYKMEIDSHNKVVSMHCHRTSKPEKGLDFTSDQIDFDSSIEMPCSWIIHAEGSKSERLFGEFIDYADNDQIIVDPVTCATSNPKVFAGGDIAAHPMNNQDLCSANYTGHLAAMNILELIKQKRKL